MRMMVNGEINVISLVVITGQFIFQIRNLQRELDEEKVKTQASDVRLWSFLHNKQSMC